MFLNVKWFMKSNDQNKKLRPDTGLKKFFLKNVFFPDIITSKD